MHVEIGMGTKYIVMGYGIIPFWMESGGVLRVTYVIWVPKCKRSLLLISMVEKKGFGVALWDGKVLIKTRGYSSYITAIVGVRESNLYRIKGQPIQAMDRNKVVEDREKVALKV
jgi:hypothetical protein